MCALLSHRTKGHDFVTIIEVSVIAQELAYSMYVLCVYYVEVCNFKQTNISLLSQGESIDIEGGIQELDKSSLHCWVWTHEIRSHMDFNVRIESDNVIHMSSVLTTLHYCFAAYMFLT